MITTIYNFAEQAFFLAGTAFSILITLLIVGAIAFGIYSDVNYNDEYGQ